MRMRTFLAALICTLVPTLASAQVCVDCHRTITPSIVTSSPTGS